MGWLTERSNQQMKIAAYCRVSTDKEEQIDSLNHQKEFFTESKDESCTCTEARPFHAPCKSHNPVKNNWIILTVCK